MIFSFASSNEILNFLLTVSIIVLSGVCFLTKSDITVIEDLTFSYIYLFFYTSIQQIWFCTLLPSEYQHLHK